MDRPYFRRVGGGGICHARACSLPVAVGNRQGGSSFRIAAGFARRFAGRYRFAGQPFDSTDACVEEINIAAIFVWNIGNRWIVATELGGIALRRNLYL